MPEKATSSNSHEKPTCFVIIGYGCRTDAATGRPLDLDKTFDQYIQPACDKAGINAFRAIDANLTGSIDLLMHRWIWLADFVIADLTTLSANVFYELGVRHALRPSTTLLLANRTLMKRIPFDLSSFVVCGYDHPDEAPSSKEDDGSDDQHKFKPEAVEHLAKRLTDLKKILEGGSPAPPVDGSKARKPESDSPVYVFLGDDLDERARTATLRDITIPTWVPPAERRRREDGSLADVIGLAKEQKSKKNFAEALRLYREAIRRYREEPKSNEPALNDAYGDRPEMKVDVSLFQSLAEVAYKEAIYKDRREVGPFESTDPERAIQIQKLFDALKILKDECALDITADAETLRIAGEIYHRLFRWNRPSDYLWPWRPHHWKWYRDFCRKFYFPRDLRHHFEHAIDCYERAWSSKDLPQFAQRAAEVFNDVRKSTWNPVLKLQYYSESLTARRRADPEKKRWFELLVTSAALLLLLLGTGLGAALAGGDAPSHLILTRPLRERTPSPNPQVYISSDPSPTNADDVLAQLRRLNTTVTAIQTTIGARTERTKTLMETAGDINGDVVKILSLASRIQTTIGGQGQPAEPILDLVQRIDRTTTATSASVGDIRQKETPEPPSGMNNVASTATTILRELRELHRPVTAPKKPEPTTLSRTGPAMQFGTLPSAVKGFAYDLNERSSTPAAELGLKLDILSSGQCPSTEAARVAAGDRVCARIASTSGQPLVEGDQESERLAKAGFLLQVAKGRSRRDGWNEDDTRRAVPFKDTQGFSYLMVVNRDERGLYAVVRRCSKECAP
jgi:tetratricopeptide (TPR) repeat protein